MSKPEVIGTARRGRSITGSGAAGGLAGGGEGVAGGGVQADGGVARRRRNGAGAR